MYILFNFNKKLNLYNIIFIKTNKILLIPLQEYSIIFITKHKMSNYTQEYPNLQELIYENNQLTSLQEYPNLQVLYCEHNQLINLPNIPEYLVNYYFNDDNNIDDGYFNNNNNIDDGYFSDEDYVDDDMPELVGNF